MQATATFQQKNKGFAEKLLKKAKKMQDLEAACGFPNTVNLKYDNGASVIDVAIWNQYGTYNSPARDFMTPAINNIKAQWGKMAKAAMPAINAGKLDAEVVLNQGGNMAQGEIRKSIVDLKDPPNAPFTVSGGWMHNKKSGKLFYAEGKGSDNPLVDTEKMLGAVTYTVRERS